MEGEMVRRLKMQNEKENIFLSLKMKNNIMEEWKSSKGVSAVKYAQDISFYLSCWCVCASVCVYFLIQCRRRCIQNSCYYLQ